VTNVHIVPADPDSHQAASGTRRASLCSGFGQRHLRSDREKTHPGTAIGKQLET